MSLQAVLILHHHPPHSPGPVPLPRVLASLRCLPLVFLPCKYSGTPNPTTLMHTDVPSPQTPSPPVGRRLPGAESCMPSPTPPSEATLPSCVFLSVETTFAPPSLTSSHPSQLQGRSLESGPHGGSSLGLLTTPAPRHRFSWVKPACFPQRTTLGQPCVRACQGRCSSTQTSCPPPCPPAPGLSDPHRYAPLGVAAG